MEGGTKSFVIRLPEHKRPPVEEKIPYFQPLSGLKPSTISPFEGFTSFISIYVPGGKTPRANSLRVTCLLQAFGIGTMIFSMQALAIKPLFVTRQKMSGKR